MNIDLAMEPLSCRYRVPGTPQEVASACDGLLRLAVARHGDGVDPYVRDAARQDAEAAFVVANAAGRFGLDEDEGMAWMWVAASLCHPGAVHQMIAVTRFLAIADQTDELDGYGIDETVTRAWVEFAENAAVPVEEVRDPQQLVPRQPRGALPNPPQAAPAPREVIPDAADGIVVLGEIGDPTSKEGAELVRRYGMFTGVRLGWKSRLPAPGEIRDGILARWPWAVEVARAVESNFAVLRAGDGERVRISPLLLVGDKGSGKTSIARYICEMAGLETTVMPCGGVSDAGGLASVTRGWATARPSAVVTAMLQKRLCNPAFVLDELDKSSQVGSANGSVMGSLLSLVLADTYHDLCLQASVDVSGVTFVATANDLGRIDEFLRDRFTIVRVPSPRECDFDVLHRNVREDFARAERLDPARVPELGPDEMRMLRGLVAGNRSARSFRLYYERIVKDMMARAEEAAQHAQAAAELREKRIAECMADDTAPALLN
jgi:ATP-dependent Lon protease, bacterial type